MKILVAGEVKGRLDLLFTRVAALHASKAGASRCRCKPAPLGDGLYGVAGCLPFALI